MRPQKIRIIDAVPGWRRYLPEGRPNAAEIVVSLDMFEAMRLVDAEGLPQDAAARSMGISTPTLCRLLGEARRRIAMALRDGWALRCDGGNVTVRPCGQLWSGGPLGHGCHGRGQGGPGSVAVLGRDAALAVEHDSMPDPCATEMGITDGRDGADSCVRPEHTGRRRGHDSGRGHGAGRAGTGLEQGVRSRRDAMEDIQ